MASNDVCHILLRIFMLVLQVKANDAIKIIDSALGVPENAIKGIEKLMIASGMNRMFLTSPNPYSFHEYVIHTLCEMIDDYLNGLTDGGNNGLDDYWKATFVNEIFDHTSECFAPIDVFNVSENNLLLDEIFSLKAGNGEIHEFNIRIHSAIAINNGDQASTVDILLTADKLCKKHGMQLSVGEDFKQAVYGDRMTDSLECIYDKIELIIKHYPDIEILSLSTYESDETSSYEFCHAVVMPN